MNNFIYSFDGENIIDASRDNKIRIYDRKSGEKKYKIAGHFDKIVALALSYD